MKLLTKELISQFKKTGSQSKVKDPIVVAKFFNPTGAGNWFATEFNEKTGEFFGYVSIFGDHCDEWGYFTLKELEDFKGAFGLGIERDLFVTQKPISEFNIISLRK